MPSVAPFHGLRYDPKHVGALSQVIAPPFDAIDAALQGSLSDRHPANAVRLECTRTEPGDEERQHAHDRAARFVKAWREQGVLTQDPAAVLTVVHQEFELDGQRLLRRGVIARVRLERFGTGNIQAHEETDPGRRDDRLRLLRACGLNTSPVVGMYPDTTREVQGILDAAVAGQPPVEATDTMGVTSRMWAMADGAIAARVAGLLGPLSVIIADGHHRYEAACDYRDEVAAAWADEHGGERLPADHPANFILMMLVGMRDPGLVFLPGHRLSAEPLAATAADLCGRLGGCFTTRTSWQGAEAAEAVWANLELEDEQGTLALFTPDDRAWTIARITDEGRARLEALEASHGPAWRDVGSTVLTRLVMADLLGVAGGQPPRIVHGIGDVVAGLTSGAMRSAALVTPAGLGVIRRVCDTGERLPPETTFLFPSVPAGLVFHSLRP